MLCSQFALSIPYCCPRCPGESVLPPSHPVSGFLGSPTGGRIPGLSPYVTRFRRGAAMGLSPAGAPGRMLRFCWILGCFALLGCGDGVTSWLSCRSTSAAVHRTPGSQDCFRRRSVALSEALQVQLVQLLALLQSVAPRPASPLQQCLAPRPPSRLRRSWPPARKRCPCPAPPRRARTHW
eukprot:scaffold1220_cov259-Pinguiococcus_pyrenoidosus.AAC.113